MAYKIGLHIKSRVMAQRSGNCIKIRFEIGRRPSKVDRLDHRVDNHYLQKSLNANGSERF